MDNRMGNHMDKSVGKGGGNAVGNVNLRGIKKSYGDTDVIHGIDLDVADGEFVVFVGPSGCGKSSMLRMIAGLEDISAGELRIGNRVANDLPPSQRGAAMVFQNYALYPHMTVAENMGFALKMGGMPKREIATAVGRAAEILRIEPLLERRPKALSGGERQRVAIGRAIVRKPKVFLFDEPLSNLDASLRVQMRLELSRLHRELGSTMIYVTHDQVEAMTMGDRIAVFNQGRIEQTGTPLQLYKQPKNQFVAGFLGSPKINLMPCSGRSLLDGQLELLFSNGATLSLPCGTKAGAGYPTLSLGVRPEHIEIVRQGEGIPVTVDLFEHLGDAMIVYLKLAGTDQLIAVKVSDEQDRFKHGERVGIKLSTKNCLLFDPQGKVMPMAMAA